MKAQPERYLGVDVKRYDLAALRPGNRLGTHCIEGWVGPRDGLDGCGKLFFHWDLTSGPSSSLRPYPCYAVSANHLHYLTRRCQIVGDRREGLK